MTIEIWRTNRDVSPGSFVVIHAAFSPRIRARVGDYVWHYRDRAGRMAMAAASDIGGARWVVLGDNSPLVNRQLIADPRAAILILRAATLWPAFLHDLFVALVGVVTIFGSIPIIAIVLPVVAAFTNMVFDRPSQHWQDLYVDQSGFEERNFNNVVAENPDLIDGRRLIRLKAPVSGRVALPGGAATIFMLVKREVEIGGIRLDRCHRLGSLETGKGPYLMDAQACRVTGQARVLLGREEAAAAIAFGETIVILDTAFLGQKAPLGNTDWLLREIERGEHREAP